MKHAKLYMYILIFLFIFSGASCKRQNEAGAEEIKISSCGDLYAGGDHHTPKTIFVVMRDHAGHGALESGKLEEALRQKKFVIMDSPSKASYILHVSLLKEGSVNEEELERLVKGAYGSAADFSGDNGSGWIVDALLVRRRVPASKRESQTRLKNITARNALDSAQMRLGLFTHDQLQTSAEYHSVFEAKLAGHIAEEVAKEK